MAILAVQAVPASARGQSLLDRPARLAVTSAPLDEALRRLQESAAVPLAYSPDLLPAGLRVSCDCETRTVRQALELLLADTELAFRATPSRVLILPARSPADA
ncbi:MAG: hypothetical protein GWN85_15550, partial [Gemmatimonadetes bacterium]|nr:hypothetical protein [Gemmatimonadota bacterium]